MTNIRISLIDTNKWIIVISGVSVMILVLLLLILIALLTGSGNSFNNPKVSYANNLSILATFIESIVVAPILETLFSQTFIYWGLNKLISNNKHFLMVYFISSSLLFAISHYYAVSYFFYTICCGGVLSYSYFIFKKQKENAFVLTALIHCILNFILFSIGLIIS